MKNLKHFVMGTDGKIVAAFSDEGQAQSFISSQGAGRGYQVLDRSELKLNNELDQAIEKWGDDTQLTQQSTDQRQPTVS